MCDVPVAETLSVEFKSDQKTISDSVIIDEVVALANTDGGELYIGVEDDGRVTGAQPQHRDAVKMMANVANRTVPPVSVRTALIGGDLPVMRIEVPRSRSIVATSAGRILRRVLKADGTPECRPMFPYEIATRLSDLTRLDYSAQPVLDATREDFDPLERERLRGIVRTYNSSDKSLLELSDGELEKALRLTVREGGEDVPTLTGMLLLGKREALSRCVPTAEAVFQVLSGTNVKVNTSFKEPLLYTIEQISNAIEAWNPVSEVTMGLFSDPVPAFDRRAIREALVNAFGHRDYSMLGRVRVVIEDAGLTISNPGGFVEGISVDNLLTAEPHGRNPCLMDALKRVGLAERTGRGIDRIYEGSLAYGRPLPDYSESNSTMVRLVLTRSEPDESFVRLLAEESQRRSSPLSIQSLLVLDVLKRYKRLTLDEMAEQVDVQRALLRQTVEDLCEAGLVEAVGSAKRSYLLSSKVYRSAGHEKEYVRQADIDRIRFPELIHKLAMEQGRVTTSDVSELLHIESDKAYYEIKKLVKEGRLKKAKNGPDAYYVPIAKG